MKRIISCLLKIVESVSSDQFSNSNRWLSEIHKSEHYQVNSAVKEKFLVYKVDEVVNESLYLPAALILGEFFNHNRFGENFESTFNL